MGVSVALCTYNGERYIEQQLQSILAQSQLPTEVVVSDDASTDTTREIVAAIAAHSTVPIRMLTNETPLGVVGNFEQAVRAAKGDLIALSDQDDRWIADRLAIATREFDARPDLILLGSNAQLIDADGLDLGHSLFEALEIGVVDRASLRVDAFGALMHRNLVTGATTMFRRSLLDTALPFDPAWVHDEWLAVLAAATGVVDLLDEPLIGYRQHGSNQIGATRLSLAGKLGRLTEPRSERNARLVRRATALVERLESLGAAVAPRRVVEARGKLAHESLRNSLPSARLRRVSTVLAEARRGGYRSYGRGAIDVVRDLIQSPR